VAPTGECLADGKVADPAQYLEAGQRAGQRADNNSEFLQQFESGGHWLCGSAELGTCCCCEAVKLRSCYSEGCRVTSSRAHDGEALHSDGGHPRCSRLRTRISRIGKG
jgi:hypothetical protein